MTTEQQIAHDEAAFMLVPYYGVQPGHFDGRISSDMAASLRDLIADMKAVQSKARKVIKKLEA